MRIFLGLFLLLNISHIFADENVDLNSIQALANHSAQKAKSFQKTSQFQSIQKSAITPQQAKDYNQNSIELAKKSERQVKNTGHVSKELAQDGFTNLADKISKQDSSTQNTVKNAQGFIEFVSLGMPVSSLRQIISDAYQFHIPVVIRGLLQNNWEITTKTLYSIIHQEDGSQLHGGVEIDPLWFRQFDISEVPALVAINPNVSACEPDDHQCKSSFDVVWGNIPIKNALTIIAQKGEVAKASAQSLLQENP